jgi:glyoxylase-like metal-dependent hydrolase (beta-lactamase superfamily II)
MTLKTLFAAVAFATVAWPDHAVPARQSPAVQSNAENNYRLTIGESEVTAVSDGSLPLVLETLLTGSVPDGLLTLIERTYPSRPVETSITAFLIKTASRVILVDTGAGEALGPGKGGQLLNSLRTAATRPEQIDVILLTHLHGDHAGGLLAGGRMTFPKASIYLDQNEERFARNEAVSGRSPERRSAAARRMTWLEPYASAGRLRTFNGDTQLFPGVATIAARGHTPGHTLYTLESKGQKIVFWGDLIHAAAVQFPHPSVAITFDEDSTKAVPQRLRAMTDAANRGYWVAAPHIPFPGIGRVEADGAAYRWVKAN